MPEVNKCYSNHQEDLYWPLAVDDDELIFLTECYYQINYRI